MLKAIEKGLPWTAFERLRKNLALPADRVAEMIAIPRRTLARRKIEKRFTREESDRLLRVARVFSRALQLYDGDREAAVTWLTRRVPALGARPITLLQTEIGAQEVERVIGALEHGIFL
ncbi:MAG TPA: antitoxin Xre-like helix-turn-helix domain-containing protein [Thermoanaerobaculia bacterium]|nr:antitoxin Xre-like helix-turn-helix domain-containing protein [Thermoanaerobaculia bacterium]